MIILGFVSLLLGALLAGRFKVFVLCPASFVIALVGVVRAHLDADGPVLTFVTIAGLVILLQFGYAAGLACRSRGVEQPSAKSQNA